MPSDEGRQILELLAQGKIDADQAYRLLRALGDIREGQGPAQAERPTASAEPHVAFAGRGRILRIRVTEHGRQKVNVAIPLAIARIGKMKLASSGLVRGHLAKFGLDLDELLRQVESSGRLIDINEGDDHVEISVE